MDDKLMYIHNDDNKFIPYEDEIIGWKKLIVWIQTNKNLIKVLKPR